MSALIPQSHQVPSKDVSAAQPATNNTVQLPKISFKEIYHAALRWFWVPLLGLLVGAFALYSYISTKPVYYTSYGALFIKEPGKETVFGAPAAQNDTTNNLERMKTVEQGIISSTVLLEVVKKHNLTEDPILNKDGKEDQSILDNFSKRVSVELRKGTRLIDVAVKDTDRERSVQIVQDIVEKYEFLRNEESVALVNRAKDGLSKEETRLKTKMLASLKEMEEFRATHPVLGLSSTLEVIQNTKLEVLNEELYTATTERQRLEAQFQATAARTDDSGLAALAAGGERGSLALNLENQIATKEAEFAKIKERYLHKHPVYIEANEELKRLSEQMASVKDDAEAALASRLGVARKREQELQKLVNDSLDEARTDEALKEKFTQLVQTAESDRKLYSQVATRLEQNRISAAVSEAALRWDERPITPVLPSGTPKKAFLILGGFLGGSLGLFVAIVLSIADPRVRESSAVERKLRLPVLAPLPHYSRHDVKDLSVQGDGVASLNRPAHLARYTAAAIDESNPMQTLLFASPFNGDGKTLCVMKCARTMVRQGYRTLVIDADFNVPGLSREYDRQWNGRHGLTAYLMGEAEAAEVLFETGLPGLWFLPTGATDGDKGDVLSGPNLRHLLEAISSMFDRVIIDMSSVLVSDDVQAVARFVNSIYLVAQKGKGKYRDLKETHETLYSSGGQVTGFIWNEGGRRRRSSDLGPVIEPVDYPAEVREVSPRGEDEPMPVPVYEAQA